ncbi:hypothetical protein PC9H_007643 [Pleurotus ostreatus]|uniref:Uncharacterized protein n=2 Tax=Pleurotus ostreatus TaxID=5322 RepID=A0A067NUV1_PLEO1|nr:uncharacterized protein PC9H_007643 [Pleurotus ostreatus]KAF7428419.1 hypothetical protein PC9H_007643 [Pleurotus ostreatus]KAJ8696559.1 hypothetical protein PTI98_006419 [Pleurotus ostreatus]KDQ27902.1 hypothetical protein PLEOSDRAFT_1104575 [Pleurotus ostreatus PC15]
MVDVESQLSISRIHRLLRPLRCTLASNTPQTLQSNLQRTYSSKPTKFVTNITLTPLERIPPPGRAALLGGEQRNLLIELSRKIYALRDCFRNVVAGVLGKDHDASAQVPSLASLCATVMGETLNQHMQELEREIREEKESVDDAELLEAVESLFEAIPAHQRKWSLVAHALDEIIQAGPTHPTLVHELLQTCLSYRLQRESSTLLRMLLKLACSPISDSDGTARLSHPAHVMYLTELLASWTGAGFTASHFVNIFTEVLSDPCYANAWPSRATTRLASSLRLQPHTFPLFLRLIHGLMVCIRNCNFNHDMGWILPSQSNGNMMSLLSTWATTLVDCILKSEPLPQASQLYVSELLQMNDTIGVPVGSSTSPIATLATVALALKDCACVAKSLLEGVIPTTSTYDALLVNLFSPIAGPNYTTIDLHAFISSVEHYASALTSANLPQLEASLWACAHSYFDRIRPARDAEVEREAKSIKTKLVSNVERSELRCFTKSPYNPRHSTSFESPNGRVWKWESSFESWVRRGTPIVAPTKKRKVEEETPTKPVTRKFSELGQHNVLSSSSLPWEQPLKTCNARRKSSAELVPKFRSLLSTALSNRTVLHDKENIVCRPAKPTSKPTFAVPAVRVPVAGSPLSSPVHAPSSEDALNLFSYS